MTNGTEHKVVGLAEELRCIVCFDSLSPADHVALAAAADRIDALEAALREAVLLLDKSDDDFVNDPAFVELAKNLLNR